MGEPGPALPPAKEQVSQGRLVPIEVTEEFHRFHMKRFQSTEFNHTDKGNARFSPIRNAQAGIIPTLYGGSTFDCAAMETVFRDVPYGPGPKYYQKSKLEGFCYSTVLVVQELLVVDLSSKALRALGVSRNELIDTEKDKYPATRAWAEAIHAALPKAQGLRWVSRQDDTAQAIVLFGDRIGPDALSPFGHSVDLLTDESAFNRLLDLAEIIGVRIVP